MVETIIELKIHTLDDLKEQENKLFTINGHILNEQERIDYCMQIINSFSYDYDLLNFDEIQYYKQLKSKLNSDIPNEEKIKNLIILFNMTERNLLFLTESYDFIVNNVL